MDVKNESGEEVVYEITDGGPMGDKARDVLGRIAVHQNIFDGTIIHLKNALGIAGGLADGASAPVSGVEEFDVTNGAMLSTYRLANLGTAVDTHPVSPSGLYVIDPGLTIR
jgi:hypothetical protein